MDKCDKIEYSHKADADQDISLCIYLLLSLTTMSMILQKGMQPPEQKAKFFA